MHTILGAGGAIGTELARALAARGKTVRLVGRTPRKINDTDALVAADLLDAAQVDRAIAGSDVCYVTAGLTYKTSVWQEQWPKLITNVVEACARYQARLVFFDNVYVIGGDNVHHITEDSPVSPSSAKGEVRVTVNRIIRESVEKGRIEAIIARAPDFFSAMKEKSAMMVMVYENLAKGKKAQWFCNADVVHSMGYAPDLAEGTAILGTGSAGWNRTWNLPVDSEALTGRQWTALFAEMLGKTAAVQVFPRWSVRALGLFIPVLRESVEMLYQYDRPYYFDASRFVKEFGYRPKSNREAVQDTLRRLGHTV